MADGSDRSNSRPINQGYTMHPYYYQQYYAAGVPGVGYGSQGVQPQMYQVADPSQPGGYRWVYPSGYPNMAMMHSGGMHGAYYFPYHPAYAQAMPARVQAVPAAVPVAPSVSPPAETISSEVTECPSAAEPLESPPPPPSTDHLEPIPLVRKTSRGFPRDKSKWRLSRTGSKPSLAIDGTGEDELLELPSSPMRKKSYSVSPRHCGSEFLPDHEEVETAFTKDRLHLVDAIRIATGELAAPTQPGRLQTRLEQLNRVLKMKLAIFAPSSVSEVVGLQNPVSSKICYLNSVLQILFPVAPLVQVLSLALSHATKDEMSWTQVVARSLRLFFHPPMGVNPSLLALPGIDAIVQELGGAGTQQDVAEALCTVLDRLHEEWKHRLVSKPWAPSDLEGAGLNEDSLIYKLFRGIKLVENKRLEIFTTIHLAPPAGGATVNLPSLLASSCAGDASLLHYLPPVLCIELSRHLSENKLISSQASIPFSGSLRIPLSCCTEDCNTDRKYQLIGAVVRSGVYANNGHFWAAQRRADKWFWINDTEVSECKVTPEEQRDENECLIAKRLDASSNWCVLVYADTDSEISIHP